MAISYASNVFAFVDSQYGTAAAGGTGVKKQVPVIVDLKYHRKVQTKTWWKQNGMIAEDTFSEGNSEQTKAGTPVIRKTDFSVKKGDTITMSQRTNLAITNNTGKVGSNQIVDSEVGWDFNYKDVKIDRWRQAVRTDGGMNEQRNPFSETFVETELDLLSDWTAQVEDSGILAALHYGHAYHLMRNYGTTNLDPSPNVNTLFGNDDSMSTSRTIADLLGDGSDNPKGNTLAIGYNYCVENNFDPIAVGGEKFFVALVSPRFLRLLRKDPEVRDALQYARERGIDNPLFKAPGALLYENVLVFSYDKVRSVINGYNPNGLTVANAGASNATITEAVYTGIGGGLSSSQITHSYFLGANAIALAEGQMKMGQRTEDDYQNIIGRDADNIWGAQRMDWLDAAGANPANQSSLVIVNSLVF
jgi:hypothetical protein